MVSSKYIRTDKAASHMNSYLETVNELANVQSEGRPASPIIMQSNLFSTATKSLVFIDMYTVYPAPAPVGPGPPGKNLPPPSQGAISIYFFL
jgi:hypothetical protein